VFGVLDVDIDGGLACVDTDDAVEGCGLSFENVNGAGLFVSVFDRTGAENVLLVVEVAI